MDRRNDNLRIWQGRNQVHSLIVCLTSCICARLLALCIDSIYRFKVATLRDNNHTVVTIDRFSNK